MATPRKTPLPTRVEMPGLAIDPVVFIDAVGRKHVRLPQVGRVLRRCAVTRGGCWVYTGPLDRDGYAHAVKGYDAPKRLAHRAVYEHVCGPIPGGLELDHLCRVRNCVNPEHLEAVTHRINVQRSRAYFAALKQVAS